jgi:MoaA/NifB/PqqE/SkfB family radical SAM enzyme
MKMQIYNPQPSANIERIELELTSTCNLKCPLCIRTIQGKPEGDRFRSLNCIISQLDDYTNLKFITIAGSIAEPTLYPDLFGLLKYLRSRNIEISLYINGDTRNDTYYKKLGVMFRSCIGHVYLTMCGSTQELHEKYRVGSKLDRVLSRLDIINSFSGNKGILTWIVFNYNYDDFQLNYQKFKSKYNTEFFFTLPMQEHFELDSDIHLPEAQHLAYQSIDKNDFNNIHCLANKHNFVQIAYDGKVVPCSLYRYYGETRCFECSAKNFNTLRSHSIYNVAEPESETSEIPMRIHYDRK